MQFPLCDFCPEAIFGRECLTRYFANLFFQTTVVRNTNCLDSLALLVLASRLELVSDDYKSSALTY